MDCSICKKEIPDYDHNAQPVNDGRCCTKCNFTKVLPARLMLKDIKNGTNERNLS